MSIFRDPIQALSLEIPAGWAYDPFGSTLTSFFFARWDRPEELLVVSIRKAAVGKDETDEQWIEQIRREIGESNPLTTIVSGNSCAVAATFTLATGLAQRVAFIRGFPVEMVVEQQGAGANAPDPWAPLNRAVKTAVSSANMNLPGDSGPEEFNGCIEAANQAFEKQDIPSVISALKEAVQVGALAWLHNLAAPDGKLEIHAPIRVAQALVHLGKFMENPYQLRDAEFILLRVQRTLENAGPKMEVDQELAKEIDEALEKVTAELIGPRDPNSEEAFSPLLSMRERGFQASQAAAKAFEAQDSDTASSLADAALNDLLSLICYSRRSRPPFIPEDIAEHLKSQGITDPEDQKTALQNAREAVLFSPLNMSLQICHCCALERQDLQSAGEAASMLLPLARLIFNADPMETGIAMNLALALIVVSGTIALTGDEDDIEEATRLVNEAERGLGSLSGKSCAEDGWIRFSGRQMEAILREVNRGIPTNPFCSRLSEVSGRFRNIVAQPKS
jgi:hypothetical protein